MSHLVIPSGTISIPEESRDLINDYFDKLCISGEDYVKELSAGRQVNLGLGHSDLEMPLPGHMSGTRK